MDRPLVLSIPDPCLVVLVGAAGSGKTTFAARHFVPDEILSSDAFRGLVAGDPTDQRATRPAFAALHRALALRMLGGRLTVVDATNVRGPARRSLLREAEAMRVPAVAIVLDLPAAIVHARNSRRASGVVPAAAVDGQLTALEGSMATGRWIGFAAVHRLQDTAEVDRVVIERVPASRGTSGGT
ncbi:MAG: AAA family ATPase [Candidatus Limnocylindrales bacterium]